MAIALLRLSAHPPSGGTSAPEATHAPTPTTTKHKVNSGHHRHRPTPVGRRSPSRTHAPVPPTKARETPPSFPSSSILTVPSIPRPTEAAAPTDREHVPPPQNGGGRRRRPSASCGAGPPSNATQQPHAWFTYEHPARGCRTSSRSPPRHLPAVLPTPPRPLRDVAHPQWGASGPRKGGIPTCFSLLLPHTQIPTETPQTPPLCQA